jgi:hydrogenase nickel incorporation protein HypA/HybF
MHEYSIVRALMEQVEATARKEKAIAVHGVRVRIGALAGVEPDLFSSAFELCRQRTICAEAALEVTLSPAVWSCPQCEAPIAQGEILRCSVCELPARMSSGDEIMLERIELEVP